MQAYSYIRFSTPEQAEGDSLRRQTEAARAYTEQHGLEFVELIDPGVSAFRGKNRDVGALRRFLDLVESGDVPRGSRLIVESLDRLSRQDVNEALTGFLNLTNAGIVIVTLSDGQEYSKDQLGSQWTQFVIAISVMARANEESQLKSKRVGDAWARKRDEATTSGKVLTAKCPGWLRVVDGKFEPIPERVAAIRRMFSLALDGHGKDYIVRQFNAEGLQRFSDGIGRPTTRKGWGVSYVAHTLKNEAVIGIYQPHRRIDGKRVPVGEPIPDYYPCILDDPDDFYRAQRISSGYKRRGKNEDAPLSNVFRGIAHCAHCGGPMHLKHRGRGLRYLWCDNAHRQAGCDQRATFRYERVLETVRYFLVEQIEPAEVLGYDTASRKRAIGKRLDALVERVRKAEANVEYLMDLELEEKSEAARKRRAREEVTLENLRRDHAEVERELRATTNGSDPVSDLYALLDQLDSAGPEINVRLNAALKRIVSRIDLG
ncbi:MAG: recombinase family protein, partial [Dehalococcoidia bacterium]